MTASTFAVALADHLLAAHAAERPVGRADLEALPAPLAHYLDRWLAQHVARGAAALDTPWVASADDVVAAQVALLHAVQRHAQIPVDRWEQVLRYAVARVVGHLLRPADAIAKTVAEAGDGPYAVETVRDRMGWFVAHPALDDVAASYFDWKNVERLGADELQQLLRRIDQRLAEEETPSEWVGHLAPLFDLAALLPDQGRAVPVPLLRAYLDARAVGAGALRDAEADGALSEAELLALLQAPPAAIPDEIDIEDDDPGFHAEDASPAAGAPSADEASRGDDDLQDGDAPYTSEASGSDTPVTETSGEAPSYVERESYGDESYEDEPTAAPSAAGEYGDTQDTADTPAGDLAASDHAGDDETPDATPADAHATSAWETSAWETPSPVAPEPEDVDGERHAEADEPDAEHDRAVASEAGDYAAGDSYEASYGDSAADEAPASDGGTADEARADETDFFGATYGATQFDVGDETPTDEASDEADALRGVETGDYGAASYEGSDAYDESGMSDSADTYSADTYSADTDATGDYEADDYEADDYEDEEYVPTGTADPDNAYPSADDFITPGSFTTPASFATDEPGADEPSAETDDDSTADDWRVAPISDALDPAPEPSAEADAPADAEETEARPDEEGSEAAAGTSLEDATREDQPLWTHFASPPAPRINDRFAQDDDEAAPPPKEEKKVPLWRQFFTGGDSGPADPSDTAEAQPSEAEPSEADAEATGPGSDDRFFGGGASDEGGAYREASASPYETAEGEADARDEPRSDVPAWDEPEEAPVDLGALERRLLGEAAGQHDWFVTQLTQGDEGAYREVLQALDAAPTWTDASQIIARDIFRRFRINIYSAPAIAFTDAVEAHFRAER